MNPRELVIEHLEHRATPTVPYTFRREEGVDTKLDEHYGSRAWRSVLVDYVRVVWSVDPQGFQPVDEGHVRDIFGSVWIRNGGVVEPGLARPSLAGYDFPTVEQCLNAEKWERARRQCAEHSDAFLCAGLLPGLFERTWMIRGYDNALADIVAERRFYEELLDALLELQMGLLEECLKLPVDGILFGDDWGDQRGVMIGAERWRGLFKERYAKLYARAHEGGKYVLHHVDGGVAEIVSDLVEIGLDVLQPVQPEPVGMDPYELNRLYGDRLSFWGGLGIQSTVTFGTPGEIKEECRRLRTEMSRGGGYILNTAKPLTADIPVENLAAVFEEFTKQPGTPAG